MGTPPKSSLEVGVYYDNDGILWIAPGRFDFSTKHWLWLLPYWGDLMLFRWPQCPLDDIPADHRCTAAASAQQAVVEVKVSCDRRLRTTGKDGQMLMDRYYRDKSDREMRLTYAPLGLDEVDRRIGNVLAYITGREKRAAYRDWRLHRRAQRGAVHT